MTYDYKCHGTAALFAAMDVKDGRIISRCQLPHRHQEWITLLNEIKKNVEPGERVYLICDNYATHKHPKVLARAKRNKRFHLHFTPTGGSWLYMIERFFRDVDGKAQRRGSFTSVNDLIVAIHEYIKTHNAAPKPIIWAASGNDILAKVKRVQKAANTIQTVWRGPLAGEHLDGRPAS